MTWLEIFFYGVIQGMTEFLPVSSSGHLALIPAITSINDPGVMFDLALHVGTAFSIMFYFKKEVLSIIKSMFAIVKNFKVQNPKEAFALNMTISTVVTILAAFAIKDLALTYGRSVHLIIFNLAFFGILMAVVDRYATVHSDGVMERPQKWRSFLIGLSQVLALFPGVSRSGITLTTARLSGLSRYEASRFSFLLSLPLVLGGMVYETKGIDSSTLNFTMSEVFWGIGLSFIIGLLTIHFFLRFIAKVGLIPFAIYRVLIAVILFFHYGH